MTDDEMIHFIDQERLFFRNHGTYTADHKKVNERKGTLNAARNHHGEYSPELWYCCFLLFSFTFLLLFHPTGHPQLCPIHHVKKSHRYRPGTLALREISWHKKTPIFWFGRLHSSALFVRSPRRLTKMYASRVWPSLHSRRPPRHTWLGYSRTQISAPSTWIVWLSCPRMCSLLITSKESVPKLSW